MENLSQRECVPCRGDVPPLTLAEQGSLHGELGPGWDVVDGHHLQREFAFKDFRSALEFTVRVGEMADEQGHHPDVHLSWGKARILVWTHKIDGLTESDFILAARAEALYEPTN
jgi:4a-hydroxytetrahydrobiopterin dehydratase